MADHSATGSRAAILNPPWKTEGVIIGDWYQAKPIIHRAFDYTDDDDAITVCGRTLSRHCPIVRWDHAQMFGRPCKRCFP